MKKRYIYYAPLIALFILAVVYQARFSQGRVQYLLNISDRVGMPLNTERLSQTITFVSPEAEQAGAHKGDQLLSVEGRPYTGRAVLFDRIYEAQAGDPLSISIRHPESEGLAGEQALTIQVESAIPAPPGVGGWLFVLVLSLAMPIFCMLLGFWVAAMRPRDPLAWLLLGLMLSFGQIMLGVDLMQWKGSLRDVMVIYQTFFQSAWPVWMLLFGVYFPERWTVDRRLPWMKWILLIPNLLFVIKDVIIAEGSLRNFAAVEPLYRLFRPYQTAEIILAMVCVGMFFAALGYKQGTATKPDVRRRLRLLHIGTTIGMTPSFVIFLIALVRGIEPYRVVPFWLGLPVWMMLFLFPLTFAYVIVVHRALDVGVVIRQGVRYAFARGGVLTLRFIISAATVFTVISLVNHSSANWPVSIAIIAIGVVFIIAMRRLGDWMIRWIDRRFFREAYNTEQILSDLSEKVRTMVETGPLLETVAHRISESLHVPRIALFMQKDGAYCPAYALGYADTPAVSFTETAGTIEQLNRESEPLRVYLDDEQSWVNRTPGLDCEREMLKTLDTQLLLPLAVKEKLPGFISLGPKQSEEPYSSTDLRLLQSVATQTGLALENSQLTARIATEVAQRERLNRELEIAREVQERLFPQKLPSISGLDYCGACRPALGVGGDYYDFLLLASDTLGIAIGDVSGKGIAAALLMASLQASLRGQAIQGTSSLAELMGNVNRLVYDASAENRYATFFYAQYETTTRRLTYVNAGHNSPVVLRKSADGWQVLRLDVGGAVVGLLREFPYQQAELILVPGDMLVAFTDGISEAMNPADEEWGEEQLIETVKACDGLSAADMITRIVEAADRFAAGAKQHDDMTLLVVRVV